VFETFSHSRPKASPNVIMLSIPCKEHQQACALCASEVPYQSPSTMMCDVSFERVDGDFEILLASYVGEEHVVGDTCAATAAKVVSACGG
jgi:hypothetical protein